MILELVLLVSLAAGLWFGFDALRCREIALLHSRRVCQEANVQLLDEAMVTQKIRLIRNEQGHWCWYRRYQFEFASDGERRYRGWVGLLGRTLQEVRMEAYRDLKQLN